LALACAWSFVSFCVSWIGKSSTAVTPTEASAAAFVAAPA
jgi:hypothetical protein